MYLVNLFLPDYEKMHLRRDKYDQKCPLVILHGTTTYEGDTVDTIVCCYCFPVHSGETLFSSGYHYMQAGKN